MLDALIGIACLACAVMAIREKRLLVAALWLSLTSALVSWMMYRLGAIATSVVELSVGAGLVTVLFVFAINIVGDAPIPATSIIPRPLAWITVVIGGLLLAWMILPAMQLDRFFAAWTHQTESLAELQQVLWNDRAMDVLLQIVFIYSGVLAVIGLLNVRGNHALPLEDPEEGG